MRIEKTITLRADASTVWDALTNPQLTKQYFFDCEAVSDWKVGSPLPFKIVSAGQETIPIKGVIKAIEPGRFLEHTCFDAQSEEVPAQHTTVTYTLTSNDGITELSVTQGDFPDEATHSQNEASWDHVLGGLKALVEGRRARTNYPRT